MPLGIALQILIQQDEASLGIQDSSLPWSFNADGQIGRGKVLSTDFSVGSGLFLTVFLRKIWVMTSQRFLSFFHQVTSLAKL